ncbi:DUF397 domain-containing protein [Actinomadura livida]|uniref:DUF397 domain-containing protein n=1 Tax=Actinomadura livida TaxID=79909 RepID=A0A7W7MX48_9ACTN|nr:MULTISPECIES: DUF397 domain-containing protein [Actinomadura]MBB4773539.1 hypothetical protein [Actinomadura catellatispora]GGU09000.1 hypothetical protein GCM10010208_36810 [Actinomadura livida]
MDLSRAAWRKSSRSSGNGGACVEVADLASGIGLRDSKNPDGPKLVVSRDAFAALVANLKR